MSRPENPWTAVPARRLSQYQVDLRVYIILALLGLAAFAGPAALLVTASRAPVSASPESMVTDPVAALAVQVAVEFASGLPTSVLAASEVDVEFGADLAPSDPLGLLPQTRRPLVDGVASASVLARAPGSYLGGRAYEMVTVKVVGEEGGALLLAVPVFVEGPALAAGVSILPYTPGGRVDTPALDYTDHPQAGRATAALQQVVREWAVAWASGDAASLKRITGDSLPGSYQPLGGFRLDRVDIVSVVDLSEPGPDRTERAFQAVRVALVMTPSTSSASPFRAEYDLRIDNPTSDFPLVTAWGPPGSSPLAPFANRR